MEGPHSNKLKSKVEMEDRGERMEKEEPRMEAGRWKMKDEWKMGRWEMIKRT
jgi:hypothetical protein